MHNTVDGLRRYYKIMFCQKCFFPLRLWWLTHTYIYTFSDVLSDLSYKNNKHGMNKFAAYLTSFSQFSLMSALSTASSSFLLVSPRLSTLLLVDLLASLVFISFSSFSREVSSLLSCILLNLLSLMSIELEAFSSSRQFSFPVVHAGKEPWTAFPSGLAFLFRGEDIAVILTLFEFEFWLRRGSGDSRARPITADWCWSTGEESGKTWLLGALMCATSLDSSVCWGDIWMESCRARGDDELELLECPSVIEVSPTNGSIFLDSFGICIWKKTIYEVKHIPEKTDKTDRQAT